MLSHVLEQGIVEIFKAVDVDEVLHLFLVEDAFVTFLLEVGVNDFAGDRASCCRLFKVGAFHYVVNF